MESYQLNKRGNIRGAPVSFSFIDFSSASAARGEAAAGRPDRRARLSSCSCTCGSALRASPPLSPVTTFLGSGDGSSHVTMAHGDWIGDWRGSRWVAWLPSAPACRAVRRCFRTFTSHFHPIEPDLRARHPALTRRASPLETSDESMAAKAMATRWWLMSRSEVGAPSTEAPVPLPALRRHCGSCQEKFPGWWQQQEPRGPARGASMPVTPPPGRWDSRGACLRAPREARCRRKTCGKRARMAEREARRHERTEPCRARTRPRRRCLGPTHASLSGSRVP